MKKPVIAYLYNVRHTYPDPNDPKTQLEVDFDDPETIEWMITHFKNCGYEVLPIEADEDAYNKLKQNRDRITLAYNYSLGLSGRDRYAQMPAILEMLDIPYTGSQPVVQAIVQTKPMMKDILTANGIPTLRYQIFNHGDEPLRMGVDFPLIVKPESQGSSAGITNASVVHNEKELRAQVAAVMDLFKTPAFAEPYITGREFSLGMLGNPPQFLPIVEADYTTLPKGYLPIDSLEVKWIIEEEAPEHLVCPARIDNKLKDRLELICQQAWDAIGIHDLCRIDVRLDGKGNPFILDINSPPGMIPPEVSVTSYFPLEARAAGIDYEMLIQAIIGHALRRYGKGL
jgi:D-alanine-D-alanine ligase